VVTRRRTVVRRTRNPRFDTEIVEKSHLWMETRYEMGDANGVDALLSECAVMDIGYWEDAYG